MKRLHRIDNVGPGPAKPIAFDRRGAFGHRAGLKSKRSAASRRDAPASTAPITHAPKSTEHGLGADSRPKPKSSRGYYPLPFWESSRFNHTGTRFSCVTSADARCLTKSASVQGVSRQ